MITSYEQCFTVHRYECDMNSNMLPTYILKRAQQLSTDHCDNHGLTEDIYEKTNTAFLLAKSMLEIFTPIKYGMSITMKTEAYAPQRAVYCRTIDFYNNGELLARVDSRWILIDTATKRIMRRPPAEIEQFFSQTTPSLESFGIEKAETKQVGKIRADYTMCDLYRHMNNTNYADIVCNNLPYDALVNNTLKKLILTYHNEVPYMSDFTLNMGEISSDGFYFNGIKDKTNHFEANIWLSKD